jgi:hypothetical protein
MLRPRRRYRLRRPQLRARANAATVYSAARSEADRPRETDGVGSNQADASEIDDGTNRDKHAGKIAATVYSAARSEVDRPRERDGVGSNQADASEIDDGTNRDKHAGKIGFQLVRGLQQL